jgi:hypothetical protein
MAGIIYDTMDKEDITTMFDYTLDPMRLFNGIMAHYRNIEEKERQAKLVEARKKYVYGFKEVEFEKLFGKNVFDLDHGYVCYGYLTFKDKVISDYPIQLGKSIQGFLDRLNEDYNNGKKYRVQHVWQVFSVNNDDKKKSYVCEKCIENKKKKYVNEIEYVLDIQAGEFVYKIGERSGIGTPYIYDNIIHFDHKYVHIPTGKTVIDASYLDHEVNATNIHDYSTINVDKYIIFSATKFKCSFHNRYEVAVKLDKITGEVTEIE